MHSATNIQKTKLELNPEKDSYLVLDEGSTLVNSIVNYAAFGGGDNGVKVADISRNLHTAQSVKDFNIEEQLIRSKDWDAVYKAFITILI